MFYIVFVVTVICTLFCPHEVSAKYVSGLVSSTSSQLVYLSKFCFDTSGPGTMLFTANAGAESNNIVIGLYDDVSGSWAATYQKQMSCSQMTDNAIATFGFQNDATFNQTFDDFVRPHYWYVAVLNCNSVTFELNYQISFTQYQENWNHQFSYDDQGLLLLYIIFFIVYVIGLGLHLYGDFQLIRASSLHPIVQLLSLSIISEFISILFYLINYGSYANNGVGSPACLLIAEIFDIISVLIFMLLLILVAKGWGITYPTLSHIQQQKVVLAIILVVIFVCYVVLFFWGIFGIDPAATLYVYQSVPGVILLCVRFLTMIYFVWCLQSTVKADSDSTKKFFYVIFGIGFSIWFISLPFIVLVDLALSGWYRAKVVAAMILTVTAVSYFGLGFLLWPSRASRYFTVTGPDVFKGSGYERL